MAHFALLDENNKVINVIFVNNEYILDENGNESEELGIAKCRESLNDPDAKLVRTSYSGSIRRHYAAINSYYLEDDDVFTVEKKFDSWVLNKENYSWDPPIPIPTNLGKRQYPDWNEETLSWDIKDLPPRQILIEDFRSKLTLTEKLLWDTPASGTAEQRVILSTFKGEFPLLIDTEETSQLVDLLVSNGVFSRERITELLDI